MARLLEYENYKDLNGVKIPDSWELSKVKYLANYLNGFAFKPAHWTDEGIPIIRIQNLTNQNADINKTSFIAPERYHVVEGDILISWSATLDVYMWQGKKAWLNQHIYKVKVNRNKIIEKYFYWTAKWFMGELNESSHGSTMQHLTTDKFGSFDVPLPPISEQHLITNFLNYETAQIDTLIEKQQTLIQLLKEKRQAVISHAVTKGLNPDAPMKDSGVEWLGEVPEHWDVKSYRHASKIYRGKFGHRPRNDPAFYDGDYPFIQTGDVARAGKIITSYSQTLNEKGKSVSQLFPAGTLMMAIAANIGDTAILGFEAYAPDSVVGFKPYKGIDVEFLRYSFLAALPAFEQTSTQSTQANLNVDRIGTVKGAFPSHGEQKKIVIYLDNMLEHYRAIEVKANEQIKLMQERRTALISAAVTGKIDVRGWRAPE
ncbi:restriction endonuclease subunit S [uncultured Psychrobacter sp.]|uniref:restriction endonuclease subunit S n=1 Tax=uncultured Psychrobacter sp. TaxID=259303 RepID=UPI00259A7417|nr:restriction endonuclease subunit S [uncultured Psychrobacter sp.]